MSSKKNFMPDELFQELVKGVQEMVVIEKGEIEPHPSRVHHWTLIDVKRVRKSTATTQTQFANILGVGIDAVKSWESGRRNPSGPVAKLLHLLSKNPKLAKDLT